MATAYSEEQWRCPVDGAFHILDLSKGNFDTATHPCTKCGQSVFRELAEAGMANTVNQPKSVQKKLSVAARAFLPSFCIRNGTEKLVTVYFDGRLEYGPNYTPDAAARIFWEAIAGHAPLKTP